MNRRKNRRFSTPQRYCLFPNRYRVKDYEPPQINFIDIDTTKDSIETSFSKIINNLNKLEKL